VSPNTVFPLYERPHNDITERIINHPRVTHHVQGDVLVLAVKDELLVHKSVRNSVPHFQYELSKVADPHGSLDSAPPAGKPSLADDVEKWRLKDEHHHSVDHARRLRQFAPDRIVKLGKGAEARVAAVTPNHVCTVMPYDICPATPAHAVPPPPDRVQQRFIETIPRGAVPCRVVVIDTGYITVSPPHRRLDRRVDSVAGQWFDPQADAWVACPPDVLDADSDGRLDGVAGHGTFIAGIVANGCRQARITVVGQRHQVMPLSRDPVDTAQLFSTEYDIARALLEHSVDAQVVSCGFAFPTLDGHPSIAFTSAMDAIRAQDAPRSEVAVVAPAGNEATAQPYWPAAHPEVVGVAATNRRGTGRAWFSNWGSWLDCAARGQTVFSTFIYWDGPLDGAPLKDIEHFQGWATWNGTSFAAPKVAAAIANAYVAGGGDASPVAAWAQLIGGGAGVDVRPLADGGLPAARGVALPYLELP
jgi:hypothetical protein